jgi:hypothetical protein
MESASPSSPTFPVAYCAICDKTVLTWLNLDGSGCEIRACVHCDAEVGPKVDYLVQSELEESGYYVGERPRKGGGCGSGGCGCSTRKG